MGAGKSAVGQLLADQLECSFIDLDDVIVQQEKRPIAKIFADSGELYFRNRETAVLEGLPLLPAAVYATGGGLVVRDKNRRLMQTLGRTVYLKASWPTLRQRLEQGTERPLVNSAQNWDSVKALLAQRQTYYEQADLVIVTDGLTLSQVATQIVTELLP